MTPVIQLSILSTLPGFQVGLESNMNFGLGNLSLGLLVTNNLKADSEAAALAQRRPNLNRSVAARTTGRLDSESTDTVIVTGP